MEYELPSKENYTIYSKGGCGYCIKAKQLLINEPIEVINCDDYLAENKEAFIEFMKGIIGTEYRKFPMIFDKTGQFIGGFSELRNSYKPPVVNDFPDPFSTN
ncbi:MAG: glutaredoxin [Gammaproteobacteria bacterium]|nr:glutaredoxin [Gammaproteobacteria bacterium]